MTTADNVAITDEVPDFVEKVEGASLAEMQDVAVDDVYQHMEWLLSRRPTALDLFKRWEAQTWSTGDLDFSKDKRHWRSLRGPYAVVREELNASFTLFFVGEQAVTDTLSPLIYAAPDEPARLFLATQLADEARHSVFFSRFFAEVVGLSGGLPEALALARTETVAGFRTIFDNQLVAAVEAVRKDPGDYASWVRGIATYHMVIEGMLALTGTRYVLNLLRDMAILPGFYAGFTAVARDESRHVNFGVRALMEAGVRDRSHLRTVEDQILELLPAACRVVAAPDRPLPAVSEDSLLRAVTNPYEVRDFSLNSLTKRLRVVGLSEDFCAEVRRRGAEAYMSAWQEYEELNEDTHPYRSFEPV